MRPRLVQRKIPPSKRGQRKETRKAGKAQAEKVRPPKRGKIKGYDPAVARAKSRIARKAHERRLGKQREKGRRAEKKRGLSAKCRIIGRCVFRGDQARIYNEIMNKARRCLKYGDAAGNERRLSSLAREFFERLDTSELESSALGSLRKQWEFETKQRASARVWGFSPRERVPAKTESFREFVLRDYNFANKILQERLQTPNAYLDISNFIELLLLKRVLARAG